MIIMGSDTNGKQFQVVYAWSHNVKVDQKQCTNAYSMSVLWICIIIYKHDITHLNMKPKRAFNFTCFISISNKSLKW